MLKNFLICVSLLIIGCSNVHAQAWADAQGESQAIEQAEQAAEQAQTQAMEQAQAEIAQAVSPREIQCDAERQACLNEESYSKALECQTQFARCLQIING